MLSVPFVPVSPLVQPPWVTGYHNNNPATGTLYYWNTVTKQSSWTFPTATASAPPPTAMAHVLEHDGPAPAAVPVESGVRSKSSLDECETLAVDPIDDINQALIEPSAQQPLTPQLATMQNQLLKIVDTGTGTVGKVLELSLVPGLYQTVFGIPLDYQKLECIKLKDLISALPALNLVKNKNGKDILCRTVWTLESAQQQLLDIVDESKGHRKRLSQLKDAYESKFGRQLDYKLLGYKKMVDFISALPALATEGTGGFITLTRAAEGKGGTVALKRAAGSSSPGSAAATDAGADTASARNASLVAIQQQILEMVDASDVYHLHLGAVMSAYKSTFNRKLDYKALGFTKFRECITALPGLLVKEEQGIMTLWRATDLGVTGSESVITTPPIATTVSPSAGYALPHSADGNAAVLCLRLLTREFRGRPWPSTKAQLRQSVQHYTDRKLHQWITIKGLNKACTKLMQLFKRAGCVVGTKKRYTWVPAVTAGILAFSGTDPVQSLAAAGEPDTSGLSAQASSSPHTRHPGDQDAVPKTKLWLIDSAEQLNDVNSMIPFNKRGTDGVAFAKNGEDTVAVDCEGVPDALHLIQVTTSRTAARNVCHAHSDAARLQHVIIILTNCSLLF